MRPHRGLRVLMLDFPDDGAEVPLPWLKGEIGERLARDGLPGLGPPSSWSPLLSNTISLVLQSAFPMFLVWGAERQLIYNTAYSAILGGKHPAAIGLSFWQVWPEVRDEVAPIIDAAFEGQESFFENFEIPLSRDGGAQTAWFTFSYSPVYDSRGNIPGVLCVCVETTANTQTEARLRFLDQLGTSVAELSDADTIMSVTTRLVGEHMGVSICAFADMHEDEDGFTIRGDWCAPGSDTIVGRYRLADFGQLAVDNLSAGRPLVICDNHREIAPSEAATFQAIGITATICMPLVKEGRLRALMAVHDRAARAWTDNELALIREVTERSWAHVQRVGAEAELRARAEQLQLATESAELGLWDLDLLTDTLYWPPRVKAMFGIAPDAPVSMAEDFFPRLHVEDRDAVADAYSSAIDPGRRAFYDVEYRTIGKDDGQVRWVAAKGRALFDERGQCLRFIGTATDITARKQAERATAQQAHSLQVLNDTGAALAGELDLEKVVQLVTDAGVGITGAQFGAFFYNLTNEAGESYTLYALSGVARSAFERFPMPRNTDVFGPTFAGAGVVRSDDITKDQRYGRSAPHYGMPAGHLPVRSYLAVPVTSRSGEVLGGLFFGHAEPGEFSATDEELIRGVAGQAAVAIDNARLFQALELELARRKKVENQQKLLIDELNHRVKNTLATVQSIVSQTSRGAPADQVRGVIEGRLLALAGAHDLLTRENWAGARLQDVLVRATSAFTDGSASRFRTDGPPVTLAPQQALALAMAMHELATNAVKYGALSVPIGWVEISWQERQGGLDLQWREHGGPVVSAPNKAGFGTRLLQRGLASDLQATVDLDFHPDGLRCQITAALAATPEPLSLPIG